jgi:hypothetical protein
MIKISSGLHVQYSLFSSDFNETELYRQFSKNNQITNFMNVCPVVAELFHTEDGRKGRHDETNILFSKFCERA